MNIFETLIERLNGEYPAEQGMVCRAARPLDRTGFWTFSIVFPDDFLVSLAWNRYDGFMLTTGFDLAFGTSHDEIFDTADHVFERVTDLVARRASTEFQAVGLAELRKLLGVKQVELAERLAMSKGGLSQLEGEDDLLAMKVGTIKKLVAGMGGSLVLSAHFPNGDRRNLALL